MRKHSSVTFLFLTILIIAGIHATEGVQYQNQSSSLFRNPKGYLARIWAEDIMGQTRVLESAPPGLVWPKFEFTSLLWIATVLAYIGAGLSSAGGIGGGPLFVPLFNLMLGYDTKTSIALSKAMVFGVAVASLFFNFGLRHPLNKSKPLIDYEITYLLQPLVLLGISIGVVCNVVFPSWLLNALLCSLLFIITYMTTKRGVQTWKVEEAESRRLQISESIARDSELGKSMKEEIQEITVWSMLSWRIIFFLVFIWLIYFVIQLSSVSVVRCDPAFWFFTFSQALVSVLATLWAIRSLPSEPEASQAVKNEGGNAAISGGQTATYALAISVFAGIVGGLLGVGVGVVLGPLFLELGLHPQSAAATSAFITLFSSSMSVIQFYLLGRLPPHAGSFFFLVSVLAALTGLWLIGSLVEKTRKASLVVFVLAAVLGFSGLIILILGAESAYLEWIGGMYMGFSGFCG